MGYIVLIFLVFFLSFLFKNTSRNAYGLFFISLILTFFSGFRYNVGVDYPNYEKIFNGENWYTAREAGFMYLVKILNSINATPQLMFLILAVVMQFFVYKIIKHYSVNYWFSLIVFILIPPFFLATFNGTRQFIAIAIFIYSLKFIQTRKWKSYFLINVFAAFMFHESILMVAMLFPIINKELSWFQKFLMTGGVILLNYFLILVISYTPYFNYLALDSKVEISKATYLIFGFILLLLLFEKKIPEFKSKVLLMNMNFFSFLTLLLVLLQTEDVLIQMFMRLNNYFFFSYIVFIPNLIGTIKSERIRVFTYVLITGFSLFYFGVTLIGKGLLYNLVPYDMNFKLFKNVG